MTGFAELEFIRGNWTEARLGYEKSIAGAREANWFC
jgi:hypothetical protein